MKCSPTARRAAPLMVLGAALAGACAMAESATVESVQADLPGHMEGLYQVEGEVVERDAAVDYVALGGSGYFTLEDATGRLNVWFGADTPCPPVMGSLVTVRGHVVQPGPAAPHLFTAQRITVDSPRRLGKDEVRPCELFRDEAEIYFQDGPEALQEYWRSQGKPVKRIVPD